MIRERLQKYIVTLVCCLALVISFAIPNWLGQTDSQDREPLKIGFLYVGDESTPYTYNFIKAQRAIENTYGSQVVTDVRENVVEGEEEGYLRELVEDGCELIFTTSYGYMNTVKKLAGEYPNIQFCQATSDNANTDPIYENYHNFMGHIYEGRYVAGVIAGMKMRELIDEGIIEPSQVKIGYVGAFPYAEVISGYTAFMLGVLSEVPETTMVVKYTNSWNDYALEKAVTKELIEDGCIIISQHSDTIGPAVVCESAEEKIYHVGYNQSMLDVAPTSSLVSCRINWTPYFLSATKAVLENKKIEDVVDGIVNGNDVGEGFRKVWVQMMDINEQVCARDTVEKVNRLIEDIMDGDVEVFKGNYKGVNPFDPTDVYDLNEGYKENAYSSAPTFHYVLEDIITIKE